ncbi:GGDEF domain-containing protein [Christensenellaceae bacterium OttesenSCG-928-K19]|nr:GGDEF domain-containing protein [Christensenellaceae bacterium OttesenSCG-928-K19]
MIQLIATLFAATVHVIHLILFSAYGIWLFTGLNVICLVIYVICFFLISKGHYTAPGILLSLEVTAYTLASVVMFGSGTYLITYFMIVLLMQVLIPYASWKVRAPIFAAIWVCTVLSIFIGLDNAPMIDISSFRTFFFILNIHVGIFGLIAQVAISNVITKLIGRFNAEQLEKYRNQANRDMLTGLYNRHFAPPFFKKLKGDPIEMDWCVAMLDLDDFKYVNDTYGHKAGDDVLCAVAETIKGNLRKSDIVFRWGGEEFLIFLMDTNLENGIVILEKLRKKLEESTIVADRNTLKITATIGVSPLDINDIEKSIKQCDKHLYEGKAHGKNQVVA